MSSRLQQKLSNEILKHYPTAQVKKLGADNFVDIHLPFVHEKRGTHLFFNTSGGKIKLGFYCRDEEFTTRVLLNSTQLEAYSQGVRLVGNPAFNTVEDAVKAALGLVSALGAPADATPKTSTADTLQTQDIEATTQSSEESNDDIDDPEEEDSRGYPMLLVPRSETVPQEVVTNYLMRWQVPSVEYAWRAGVRCFYPDWVEELSTDDICPILTHEQIDGIISMVRDERIIPILDYAPEELLDYTKSVWWIVPFCIWKEDVASLVFVDKNGIHVLIGNSHGEAELRMGFGWDSVGDVEFETEYNGDSNLVRLTLYKEDSDDYLTFDEFVCRDGTCDRGSYLSVIEAIWLARRATIEASKGQPFWLEGSGGEELVEMDSSKDISDKASMCYRVGIHYFDSDDFTKAILFLRKAVEESDDFERLNLLAKCLVKIEEFEEAISVYRRADAVNEDDIYVTRELARLVIRVHDDFEQACEILTEGIEKFKSKSSDVEHYDLLISERGLVHRYLDQPELTIADLEWSRSINSEHQKIWRLEMLGEAYINTKQYEKAIECLLESIEADSNADADKFIKLGHAYYLSKNYSSAINAYETAIKSGSDDAFVMYRLSFSYNALEKNYDRVLECVEIGLKSAPTFKWLYREKAKALSAMGRHGEAVIAFKDGLSRDPSATEFHYEIGKCHRLNGNHIEAISNLQKAIEVDSNDIWAYYQLGLSQRSLHQHPDALSSFKKALEIDSNWVTALNEIGQTLMLLGEVDEAIEYFNRSLQINERQVRVSYQRGMAYHKKMMFEEAIENYKYAEHNWLRDLDYFYNREVAKRQIPDVVTDEKDVLGSDRKELVLIALKSRAVKEWYRSGGAWDTEESIRFADEFIAYDPTNVEAYLLKIKLLMKFDSDSSTIHKIIQKCLELEPSNAVALNLRERLDVDEQSTTSPSILIDPLTDMNKVVDSGPSMDISEIQFENRQQVNEYLRRLQSENNVDEIKKITDGIRSKQVKEGSITVAEAFILLSLQGMDLAGNVISVVLRDVIYTLKDVELGIEYEGDEYTVKCSGASTETVTLEYILDDSEENQEKIRNNLFNFIQIDSVIKVSELVSSDYDTDLSDYEFFSNTLEVYQEDGSLVLDSKLISDIWDFVEADDLLSAADYEEFTVKEPGEVSIK